ncbi:MAG: DUF1648 domain-containing protein [Coriobacteriaceae bacterium]|nr:DUF1648 domain-containing protein [Coriobacteriaceae bacterium]
MTAQSNKNRKQRLAIFLSFLVAISPLFLTIILLSKLPDRIPLHWADGAINRIGNKFELLFFGIPPLFLWVLGFTIHLLKKKASQRNREDLAKSLFTASIIISIAFTPALILILCKNGLSPHADRPPFNMDPSALLNSMLLMCSSAAFFFYSHNRTNTTNRSQRLKTIGCKAGILLAISSVAILIAGTMFFASPLLTFIRTAINIFDILLLLLLFGK